MKLYLVQHAEAASEHENPQRPLTEAGRQDIQMMAAFIEPLNITVDYLWHSEKTRAIQTSEVLAEVVKVNEAKMGRDGLNPNDDVKVVREEIALANKDVMIVGHLPFLGRLASLLLVGSESANVVAFKQGGIVCLSCLDDNLWQIDWMVTPELFD